LKVILSLIGKLGLKPRPSRTALSEPDLVAEYQYTLPETWEHRIELLKRRVRRLFQKILSPDRLETRLDDYVKDLVRWLRSHFKQARSHQWQEPEVRIKHNVYGSIAIFLKFILNYYVDGIKLEGCERGKRVNSEMYREITRHLQLYITQQLIS